MKTNLAPTNRQANDQARPINIIRPQTGARAGQFRILLGFLAVVVIVTTLAVLYNSSVSHPTRQLYIQSMSPLPFGPGWAADYGTTGREQVKPSLPFGPGLAATYGTAGSKTQVRQNLPFGPGLAATYGTSRLHRLPFGPGYAATYGVPAR